VIYFQSEGVERLRVILDASKRKWAVTILSATDVGTAILSITTPSIMTPSITTPSITTFSTTTLIIMGLYVTLGISDIQQSN